MGIEAKLAYRNTFLKSEFWSNFRIKKFLRDGTKCSICEKSDPSNDIHHIYYPSNWNQTTLGDTVVLCRDCHALLHKFIPVKKTNLEDAWGWFLKCRRKIKKGLFPKAKPKTVKLQRKIPSEHSKNKEDYHRVLGRFFRAMSTAGRKHNIPFCVILRKKLEGKECSVNNHAPLIIHG